MWGIIIVFCLNDKYGNIISCTNISLSLSDLGGNVEHYNLLTDNMGFIRFNSSLLNKNLTLTYLYNGTYYVKNNVMLRSNDIGTILTCNDLVCAYGEGRNLTGKLMDQNGNILAGYHVGINLTRLSNGASGVYWLTTDYTGEYRLVINLATGEYSAWAKFLGENGYSASISSIATISVVSAYSTCITINELINIVGAGETINGFLFDVYGNFLENKQVNIKLTRLSNGATGTYPVFTDSNGFYSLPINLASGFYSAEAIFNQNGFYLSTNNTTHIKIYSEASDFQYSLIFPMYANVTMPIVAYNYTYTQDYGLIYGSEGIFKLPGTRNIRVTINGEDYDLISTITKQAYYSSELYVEDYNYSGDKLLIDNENLDIYYFIPFDNNLQANWFTSNYTFKTPGLLIKRIKSSDYLNITFINNYDNSVNQFGIMAHNNNVLFEIFDYVINGATVCTLNVSSLVGPFDETCLIYELGVNNFSTDVNGISYISSDILYYQTGEKIYFVNNVNNIFVGPTIDIVGTSFVSLKNLTGNNVYKDEKINYVESVTMVQSYAIVNTKITNDILIYWLNNNQSYIYNKAIYNCFLNSLGTIWLTDKFADNRSLLYNVNYFRNEYLAVLSGVNYDLMYYIHCPDPSMKMILVGNNQTNISLFKTSISFHLTEIERIILKLSGINASSSLTTLYAKLFNGYYYQYYDEGELSIIKIVNSSEMIIINNTFGLLYCLNDVEGFLYKGANGFGNYCCPNSFFTPILDNLINNLLSSLSDLLIDDEFKAFLDNDEFKEITGLAADACFMFSATAITAGIPLIIITGGMISFPVAIAIVVPTAVGFTLQYISNGGLTNPSIETILKTGRDSVGSILLSFV